MKTRGVVGKNDNGKVTRLAVAVMVLILVALLAACGAPGAFEPAAVEIDATKLGAEADALHKVERLSFSRNTREIVMEGALFAADHTQYVFWGNSGEALSVTVTSPQEDVSFQLEGADFRQRYKPGSSSESSWEGTLILSQDHLLTVHSGDAPTEYQIELSIAGK